MSLLDTIMKAGGGQVLQELGGEFGLSESSTKGALEALVPVLAGGMQRNTRSRGGVDSLLGALARGNHQRYLDRPNALRDPDTVRDGNGILGHVLGSKEVSREVAGRAAQQTGLDSSLLKKMLPLVATLVMGSLSKNSQQTGMRPDRVQGSGRVGAGELLSAVLGGDSRQGGGGFDDLLDLAGKFLR